ncbi:MAG: hypothetical protein JSS91_01995 [Bacteroidetes bacterium]|nr:hypothetical protein [Bacteroidota bacterium]
MEEFLGVLFCGGKGTRLGEITQYISKSFVPVYDKPVFKFGLESLTSSKLLSEIIILTNKENNDIFSKEGFETIIQNDKLVNDMFSGWEFIKEVTGTKKNGVLVPSDNICDSEIDGMISIFEEDKRDFLFSLFRITDKKKLSEMGSFDRVTRKFTYKDPEPETEYGVIAPYVIRNSFQFPSDISIFESENSEILLHNGYWYDTGDIDSLLDAGNWRRKNK